MAYSVIEMNCPGCNAPVSVEQKECEYCHSPVVISTFNSFYTMSGPEVNKYAAAYRKALAENPEYQSLNTAVAMCYLKLKLYDKSANKAIEKVYDDLHASPTKIDPSVKALERNILGRIADLEYAVQDNSVNEVSEISKDLLSLIEQRNTQLKNIQ